MEAALFCVWRRRRKRDGDKKCKLIAIYTEECFRGGGIAIVNYARNLLGLAVKCHLVVYNYIGAAFYYLPLLGMFIGAV